MLASRWACFSCCQRVAPVAAGPVAVLSEGTQRGVEEAGGEAEGQVSRCGWCARAPVGVHSVHALLMPAPQDPEDGHAQEEQPTSIRDEEDEDSGREAELEAGQVCVVL